MRARACVHMCTQDAADGALFLSPFSLILTAVHKVTKGKLCQQTGQLAQLHKSNKRLPTILH